MVGDRLARAQKRKRIIQGKARAGETLKNYRHYKSKIDDFIFTNHRQEFWNEETGGTDFAKFVKRAIQKKDYIAWPKASS